MEGNGLCELGRELERAEKEQRELQERLSALVLGSGDAMENPTQGDMACEIPSKFNEIQALERECQEQQRAVALLHEAKRELDECLRELATAFGEPSFGPEDILNGPSFIARINKLKRQSVNVDPLKALYLKTMTILKFPSKLVNCKSMLANNDAQKNHSILYDVACEENFETLSMRLDEFAPKPSRSSFDSFVGEFEDPGEIKDGFVEYISAAMQQSTRPLKLPENYKDSERKFYAPYITLCQSSGFGKSRLVYETRDKFVLFYSCLRPVGIPGLPTRSSNAEYLSTLKQIHEFVAFFVTTLNVWASWKGHPSREGGKQMEPGDSKIWATTMNTDSQAHKDFWDEVISKAQALSFQYKTAIEARNVKDTPSELESKLFPDMLTAYNMAREYSRGKAFVFVFDEARCFAKEPAEFHPPSFLNLRRALRTFCGDMFAILIDTTSQLANFMPTAARDPSRRASIKGTALISPVYYIPSLDLVKLDKPFTAIRRHALKAADAAFLPLEYDVLSVIELGRPLFTVDANAEYKGTQGGSIDREYAFEILNNASVYAKEKLCEGGLEVKAEDRFACACLRLGLCYIDAARGDELVKKNMAICLSISKERTAMITRYTSEPLLAQAACVVLKKTFTPTLSDILASLKRADLVSPNGGSLGELVAVVVLLRAFDTAKLAVARAADMEEANVSQAVGSNMETEIESQSTFAGKELSMEAKLRFDLGRRYQRDRFYCTPISMLRFLISFLSTEEKEQLVEACAERGGQFDWDQFKSSWLCFSSFYHTSEDLSSMMLHCAFMYNSAITAKPGQQGYDLVIPTVLPVRRDSACEGEEAAVPPSIENMGAITIQVKSFNANALSNPDYYNVIDNLHQSTQKLVGEEKPCMAIIMQVGRKGIVGFGRAAIHAEEEERPRKKKKYSARFDRVEKRVFIKDNILYVIKPFIDRKSCPFLSEIEIRMLRETTKIYPGWNRLVEAHQEVGMKMPPFPKRTFVKFMPLDYQRVSGEGDRILGEEQAGPDSGQME